MYQALYRKYRPLTFTDVCGQDHITVTLKNELSSGRIFHAYLFTGSRGTGKTSCAKILSKAVNCLSPTGGDPCNHCEMCVSINDGSDMDVLEIDAASNNGVENIRELRERAVFTPAKAKYRVYIIDEVHMLSTGAFNALLKTLEEPPPHVIFILATTEVHKLPATILSRCQRFDFKRIEPEIIAARLQHIASEEGFSITGGAATLVAALADGGMRDALSILDLCVGEDIIDEEKVLSVSGMAGREYLLQMADCFKSGEAAGALELVGTLHKSSVDMLRLCEELIGHFRDLMLIKTVKNPGGLVVCSNSDMQRMTVQSQGISIETIIYTLKILQNALDRMAKANRRTEMEMAVVKLCSAELDESMDAVLDRISRMERAVKSGAAAMVNTAVSAGVKMSAYPVAAPVITETQEDTVSEITSVMQKEAEADRLPWDDAPPNHMQESRPAGNIIPSDEAVPQPESGPPPVSDGDMPPTAPQDVSSAPAVNDGVQSGAEEIKTESTVTSETALSEWPEILAILAKTCPLMHGVLQGSLAYSDGDLLLIDANSDQFRDLVKGESIYKDFIRKAALEATGIKYRLGPYRKKEAEISEEADPFDILIRKAGDMGLIN